MADDGLVANRLNLKDGGKNVDILRNGWFDDADGTRLIQTMLTENEKKKGVRTILEERSTVAESWLVWFDLMIANEDWDGQILFDHIMGRFSTLKVDTSTIASVISVQNLSHQRSRFNNTPFRRKTKLQCLRFRQKFGIDASSTMFDFFLPVPVETNMYPSPENPRLEQKKQIENLQKKWRRWKSKSQILRREITKLSDSFKKKQENADLEKRILAKRLRDVKYRSKKNQLSARFSVKKLESCPKQ